MTGPRAVIGAGGIGAVVTESLVTAGSDTVLCVRTPCDSLDIERDGGHIAVPVKVLTEPALAEPVDWMFVCVKAQDNGTVTGWLSRLMGPHTVVVLIQNGVDHRDRLAGMVPCAQVLPAVTYVSAEKVAPGRIVHRPGRHVIVPAGQLAADLATLFDGGHVGIVAEPDFTTAIWRKLMSNVAANPVTCLAQRRSDVYADPRIDQLCRLLLDETLLVARAEGAALDQSDVDGVMRLLQSLPSGIGSSMLYDREAGRSLEYEFLNGAVMRAAAWHGIDAPVNFAMLALLGALRPAYPTIFNAPVDDLVGSWLACE